MNIIHKQKIEYTLPENVNIDTYVINIHIPKELKLFQGVVLEHRIYVNGRSISAIHLYNYRTGNLMEHIVLPVSWLPNKIKLMKIKRCVIEIEYFISK